MKKLLVIAAMAVTSCSIDQVNVQMMDGQVVTVDKPVFEYKYFDTIIIRQFIPAGISPIRHSIYGKYVGVMPTNPDPCSTYKTVDSTNVTVCTFYLKGVIIK